MISVQRFHDLRVLPGGAADPAGQTILVESVTKHFGSTVALCDVSFQAQPRQAIALWGANGAGKSTLIRSILGLFDFDGRIVVAGHDVAQAGKRARACVGYVPQDSVFYDLPVDELMAFFAALKGVEAARCRQLRAELGLVEHERKPVSALSGGLRQRLALGLALLADPPVLLLDEPTASLDARVQRDYLSSLRALRDAGKTIVFATHRIEEIERLSDRVLVMEGGRIVAQLAPEELRGWE